MHGGNVDGKFPRKGYSSSSRFMGKGVPTIGVFEKQHVTFRNHLLRKGAMVFPHSFWLKVSENPNLKLKHKIIWNPTTKAPKLFQNEGFSELWTALFGSRRAEKQPTILGLRSRGLGFSVLGFRGSGTILQCPCTWKVCSFPHQALNPYPPFQ